jgi:hypothetical protein
VHKGFRITEVFEIIPELGSLNSPARSVINPSVAGIEHHSHIIEGASIAGAGEGWKVILDEGLGCSSNFSWRISFCSRNMAVGISIGPETAWVIGLFPEKINGFYELAGSSIFNLKMKFPDALGHQAAVDLISKVVELVRGEAWSPIAASRNFKSNGYRIRSGDSKLGQASLASQAGLDSKGLFFFCRAAKNGMNNCSPPGLRVLKVSVFRGVFSELSPHWNNGAGLGSDHHNGGIGSRGRRGNF